MFDRTRAVMSGKDQDTAAKILIDTTAEMSTNIRKQPKAKEKMVKKSKGKVSRKQQKQPSRLLAKVGIISCIQYCIVDIEPKKGQQLIVCV